MLVQGRVITRSAMSTTAAAVAEATRIHQSVTKFYSELESSSQLSSTAPVTSVCPLSTQIACHVVAALSEIHPSVQESCFGCGLPFPDALEGCRILDLGSGTGRDCFLLAKFAGAAGSVVGVDMGEKMIERSSKFLDFHRDKFGFGNVRFQLGYLEELDKIPLEAAAFDVAISNCVINLCPDKEAVFRQAFRVLKTGGELCFSDVYAAADVPSKVAKDERAWNEGFGGALQWDKFVALVREIGFVGPVILNCAEYSATDPELSQLIGDAKYWARTCRLFKLNPEDRANLTTLIYKGTITGCKDAFKFTLYDTFKTGEAKKVSEEVARILFLSRFEKHFEFQ